MSRPNMRTEMPTVAAIIDDLREAFGADEITDVIRIGLRPDCEPQRRFFATEAGHVLGQRYVPTGTVVAGSQMVLPIVKADAVVEEPTRGRKRA